MDRPTATLRRLLILESLQDYIAREIIAVREQMRLEDLKIIERKDNTHDVWIQYQSGNKYDEAIFMRKMLDAESRNAPSEPG